MPRIKQVNIMFCKYLQWIETVSFLTLQITAFRWAWRFSTPFGVFIKENHL